MVIINTFKKIFLEFLYPKQSEISIPTSQEIFQKAEKNTEFDGKEVLAIFNYKDLSVKKLVWQLKYKGDEEAARVLAEILHQEIMEAMADWVSFEDFKDPVLIPTPLSKKKLKLREYNQTEMLVREIEKMDENKNFTAFYDVLEKKKDTPDQTSIKTKKGRMNNLKGCFCIKNAKKIKDRNIILIDDVVTTGATINEMKKTLKKNKVGKIKAVVIAH